MELEPQAMRVELVGPAAIAPDGVSVIPSNTLLGKLPGFRAPRLQFRELVGAWRELVDTVAEQTVAPGHWFDRR
jgi:hypothetical protein